MLDGDPSPGIGDMNLTVGRLNDSGVGITRFPRLVFQSQDGLPGPAVPGDRNIQDIAVPRAPRGVVVDQELARTGGCGRRSS